MTLASVCNQVPSSFSFSSFWAARQKAISSDGEIHLPEVPERWLVKKSESERWGFFHELIEKNRKEAGRGG